MSVVDLTFRCERSAQHSDNEAREWSAQGQERVMDPLNQELSPVVLAHHAACPECGEIGIADYQTATVYVIPEDASFKEQVEQIEAAIEEASG